MGVFNTMEGEACTGRSADGGQVWLGRCGVCQEVWLNGGDQGSVFRTKH